MKPTGGGPQVTPVPPPTSLFPGITGAVGGNMGPSRPGNQTAGSQLGSDLYKTLHDVTSGVDVNKIYSSIVEANKRQQTEGEASLVESYSAMGLRGGSDLMRAQVDYRLQNQKDLSAQLEKMSFQNEALKMGGAEMIQNLATSFTPSAVVTQAPAGQSIFSQVASAGEAAMMLFLMAGA